MNENEIKPLVVVRRSPGGWGGTPIYELYRYVPHLLEIGYGFCLFSLKGLKRGIDLRGQV